MKRILFVVGILLALGGLEAQTAPAAPGSLRQLNNSFADVFEKASPGVVVIESARSTPAPMSGLPQGLISPDRRIDQPGQQRRPALRH